ncbi:MAG TPA: hypothetical protein VLN46_02345 [Gillisia sp.]|nr:hypothetical protein [Gillisia sp.]
MQFLKTFGVLLLLLLSNTDIASATSISFPQDQENQVDFQFSEDQQNLFESTLISQAEVLAKRMFIPVALVPENLCPRKISKSNGYFVFSRTIVPSLDITDIIFPFHTFL